MGCAPGDTRAPERRWSGCEVRDGGARRLVYTGITLALAVAALVFAGTHQIGVMAQRAGTWYGIAMRPGRVYAITGTPRWQGAAAARVSLPAGPAGVASDRSGDMSIGFLDHGPVFVPARTGTYFGVPMRAGHMYLIPGARTRLGLGTGEVAADRSGNVLVADQADEYFSVHRFFGAGQRDGRWYVNFERPSRRTPIGIDTFDLLLDLVVEPDLSGHTWKDEDEYAQARRLGLIDDTLHSRIEHTRGQVLALIEGRSGPFAADWSGWRPDPAWPDPVLPANALTLPATP